MYTFACAYIVTDNHFTYFQLKKRTFFVFQTLVYLLTTIYTKHFTYRLLALEPEQKMNFLRRKSSTTTTNTNEEYNIQPTITPPSPSLDSSNSPLNHQLPQHRWKKLTRPLSVISTSSQSFQNAVDSALNNAQHRRNHSKNSSSSSTYSNNNNNNTNSRRSLRQRSKRLSISSVSSFLGIHTNTTSSISNNIYSNNNNNNFNQDNPPIVPRKSDARTLSSTHLRPQTIYSKENNYTQDQPSSPSIPGHTNHAKHGQLNIDLDEDPHLLNGIDRSIGQWISVDESRKINNHHFAETVIASYIDYHHSHNDISPLSPTFSEDTLNSFSVEYTQHNGLITPKNSIMNLKHDNNSDGAFFSTTGVVWVGENCLSNDTFKVFVDDDYDHYSIRTKW